MKWNIKSFKKQCQLFKKSYVQLVLTFMNHSLTQITKDPNFPRFTSKRKCTVFPLLDLSQNKTSWRQVVAPEKKTWTLELIKMGYSQVKIILGMVLWVPQATWTTYLVSQKLSNNSKHRGICTCNIRSASILFAVCFLRCFFFLNLVLQFSA